MANRPILLALSLCFVLSFHSCIARQQDSFRQQEADQYRQQNECDIRSLNAQEPSDRFQSEAGLTEFWDSDNEQFQCAGVAVFRRIIQPQGLLLPSYSNAPKLSYIIQGRGIQGTLIPGCAETFQSSQQSQEERGHGEQSPTRSLDQHQKIRHFREGDVFAIPAGVAHWVYNDGERDLVVVTLLDTINNANQLDQDPRNFFLAGNPQGEEQQGQWQASRRGGHERQSGNIFRGFDLRVLAEAFGVDHETAKKLQSENDQRGSIIRVERGLQVVRPPQDQREEEQRERGNGLEETICSARLRENINDPSRADIYNPRAGRLTTVNSLNLPILRHLRLSAERGVLHRNGIFAPHWTMNAHSIVYVTRGEARCQIVNNRGQTVFDDNLREGRLVVVPQNFAVVKQAGEGGFEWVAFKTNDNAMINTLAGRTSVLRALPVDVIASAYQISREEARRLKFERDETTLFGGSRSERRASV
ncbi:11S globulin-like [Cornus florida]|uniref:11S globulin-like n=1 Tax=Cornus florida TaxID=4283 RepID=UPI0028988538|nr:11S globulin-like [Cornus florida]